MNTEQITETKGVSLPYSVRKTNTAPRKFPAERTGACSPVLLKAAKLFFSVSAEEADILLSTDSVGNN